MFSTSAMVGGPIIKDKLSFAVSARLSYYKEVTSAIMDWLYDKADESDDGTKYNFPFEKVSFYDFKAGDKIDMDLRCGTTYTPITASVVMPDKPEIEAECIGYETGLSQKGYSDSLMIVKLKIKDNGRKENFYMLNVASYSVKLVDVKYNKFPDNIIQRNDSIMHTWGGTDYFLSAEPILTGKQAESSENTSAKELIHPLFDDATFNGKNYECIIKCKVPQYALPEMGDITATFVKERKLLENKRYTVIRLDELSEDYYKYLKHAETKDRTALPVSNINGGYGVLGAVNRSEIIRLDVK